MDIQVIANNLLSGPVLFFVLGFIVVSLKSDVELPAPVPKLLSLYLMIAIGLKGGIELHHNGLTLESSKVLFLAVMFSALVPIYTFFILKMRLDSCNAAAICATYGSVSAVTFITAVSVLESLGIEYHGFMVAAMALMEAPAIIIAVIIVNMFDNESGAESHKSQSWTHVVHDSLLHGPIVVLLGSMFVGRLMSEQSVVAVKPFFTGLFPGVLCIYLFEMGLGAAKRLAALNRFDRFLMTFAVVVPLCNGLLAIGVGYECGLTQGDALLLSILCASASYVAVPAAMQLAIPKADPGLYLTMALGITFPFNIALGIPLFLSLSRILIP